MSLISRQEAKTKIGKIIAEQTPIKTGVTLPIRIGTKFNVYRIPLDLLVPNVLNDRIAWRIREWQAENNRKLSHDNETDIQFVYELINKEDPADNDKTIKDIAEKGQQVDGVITKDGIIIDGNRRATLIRRLFNGEATKYNKNVEEFRCFNAIVLPEDIEQKEIMALETALSIGEIKKVDYNPICVYIKVDNLTKVGYNDEQIASYMNCKPSEVKEKKEVFKLMNEYLQSINKPEHFTLLEGLEDQFLNTKTVFKRMDNSTYQAEWEYTDEDVANFKQVCFDYIRAKFEGKKYRDVLVGKPNKSNGVFISETVWKKFYDNHTKIIESKELINENDWIMLGKNQFKANLSDASAHLAETLQDKNVSQLINTIQAKVDSLKVCIQNKELMAEEDIKTLKSISSDIWNIIKNYK